MSTSERKEREVVRKASLSLTPMIDVVFLLLIFFMVGMQFRAFDRQLRADLPRGEGRGLAQEISVRIAVKHGGSDAQPQPQYYVEQVAMRDKEHLKRRLRRYAEMPGGRNDPVIIDPSDDAWHDWVMAVRDILIVLRCRRISFKQ